MKIAQCTYSQAGVKIHLCLYFDLKAFDEMTPRMNDAQEDEFMRLVCDSIAAALPRENIEKHIYIKRILRFGHHLKMLCTDGLLVDSALTLPISQQAYSSERIQITETDQLPSRLKMSNDLLKNINAKLPSFEQDVRQTQETKTVARRTNTASSSLNNMTQELSTDKTFSFINETNNFKKEIRELAKNNLNILDAMLRNRQPATTDDAITRELKNNLRGLSAEKYREIILQKINEIKPAEESFATEAEAIDSQIANQTNRLMTLKHQVIHALHDAAQQYHELILKKFNDAPLHAKKAMALDFNKKFAGIAMMSENGELSSLQQTQGNLETLSLESLQQIISNDSKTNPGLLQKCNTSFTEESPELKIVLQNLYTLDKNLPALFKDTEAYANKEWTHITRIPVPRSFQFKFTDTAWGYRKAVDDFCKMQKETLMTVASKYKKIMQISNLHDDSAQLAAQMEIPATPDLHTYKEASDTMLALANKDYHSLQKNIESAQKVYQFISTHIDNNLQPLIEKISILADKMSVEAKNAETIIKQIADLKSKIDININHFLLHPDQTADMKDVDMKIKEMSNKRSLLLAKTKVLQDVHYKLDTYERLIKRIGEIDLSATKDTVVQYRHAAKEFLLQFMKQYNANPQSAEKNRQLVLQQYSRVDSSVLDVDKLINELAGIKNEIVSDLERQTEFSSDVLEKKFHVINDKMQVLTSTLDSMNQDVKGLRELTQEMK